jgi:phosphoribosylformylglycinamidine cyclo-ligase
LTYKQAGVDVEAGHRAVDLMKAHIGATHREGVLSDIGGFSGMFALPEGLEKPILVSGTDGVGTKLSVAFMMEKHDTIGIDCVAMCVNDVLCCGAQPLFFLDYIATGRLVPEKVADIVKGVSLGCRQAGCALIGGETAEMPGFYKDNEYDIAGFAVGIVERKKIVNGSGIKPGDAVIGLESSGLHSNGFSLVRRLLFTEAKMSVSDRVEEFGMTLGEELLKPTSIYVKPVLDILNLINVKGIAHVTGGGFYENLPRMLPEGTGIAIKTGSWQIPPVFEFIKSLGGIEEKEMYSTFNMGIGMALVVSPEDADGIIKAFPGKSYIIGEIKAGNRDIEML